MGKMSRFGTHGQRRVGVVVLVGSAAVLSLVSTASAAALPRVLSDGPSFSASASANGVDFTITNQSVPIGLVPEGGGPATSAALDSLSENNAFASFPYPGAIVASLPSTAGALVPVPVPAYPLYVATQSGDAPKDDNAPGIALHAESDDSISYSKAVFGQDSSGGVSTSKVEELSSSGDVQATADTTFKAIDLGPELSLSGVESHAQVVADASTGNLTRSESLSFGHLTIPGLAITIPSSTPGTVPVPVPVPGLPQLPPPTLPVLPIPVVGGMTIQAPDIGYTDGSFSINLPGLGNQKFALPASTLTDALTAAGITMTIQQPTTTPTGVTAAAVTFSYVVPAPPDNNYFTGTTTVAYTIGGAQANITLNPAQSTFGDGGTDQSTVPVTSSDPSQSPGTTTTTSPASTTAPDSSVSGDATLGSGTGISLPDTSSTAGDDTASTPPPVVSQAQAPAAGHQALASSLSKLTGPDSAGIYLVLVAVAFVGFTSASVLRFLGVRSL